MVRRAWPVIAWSWILAVRAGVEKASWAER